MDILLSHGYFLHEDQKEGEIMRPYPTLGLLYISAYLKQHGLSVHTEDSTFSSQEEWKANFKQNPPKILALYTNLMTKIKVLELALFVKKEFPYVKLIVGGPDVSYNQLNYLKAGFDFCVIGEGEQTMLELCTSIFDSTDFSGVSGISYQENNELVTTAAREKVKEIGDLPFPDRHAIDMEAYLSVWKKHHGMRTLNISTQRGCPYTCKWCSTAVYGQSYRRNTPERVVQEIQELIADFQVEALWFVDDVFTVSHKWIKELHAEFKSADLTIPFEIITRAERLNAEILGLLKEMGCFRIWIGAESGSQRIIDKMDRRVELITVQETMQLTQKLGMEAGTFIMVGYPGETHEDILQTMQHIEACNPTLLTITKAYPIKGTGLYAEIEKDIVVAPEWNSSTDREIEFALPYSSSYYTNAIRFLVNGWQAKRTNSLKFKVKKSVAKQLMKWNSRKSTVA